MTDVAEHEWPSSSAGRLVGVPTVARPWRLPETWLLWVVWGLISVSQLAQSLGQRKEYTPITGAAETTASWAVAIGNVSDGLLLLACAAAVVVGLRADPSSLRSRRRLGRLAILLAPWLALVLGTALAGGSIGPGVLPYPAIALAFWALRPRLAAVQVIGYQVVVTAVASMVLALVAPSAGRYVGGAGFESEKLVSSLGILAGFLPTGNQLGGYLAIGIGSVLAIRSRPVRWVGGALTLLALVWCSARTGWVAAGVVVALLVVLLLVRGRALRRRRWLAGLGLTGIAVLAAALPFVVTVHTQFNHRGGYWIFLRERWGENPLFGHGVDYFTRLAKSSDNLGGYAYHAHNVAMQVLVTGGLLTASTVVVLLVLVGRRAVSLLRAGTAWAVLVLAALAVEAAFEIPLSFADNVKVSLAGLLPLMILAVGRRTDEERG